MAHSKLSVSKNWRRDSVLFTTLVSAGLLVACPAFAQTVVIGGSGSSPVEVNMRALGSASPIIRAPSAVYNPTVARQFGRQTGSQDYSKSNQIVYGNEVINLVAPGSRPKKKTKTIMASKPAIKKQTAAKSKPTTEQKQKVAKVETIKKQTPVKEAMKVEAKIPTAPKIATEPKVVSKPKVVAKKAVPAPIKPEPKKEIIVTTKPAETKKVAPEKSVPEIKTAEKPTPEVNNAPKAVAKSITPDVEPPQETATTKSPEKEMQVASIAPKSVIEPVAKNSEPIKDDTDDKNQIFFEPEQTKLPNAAISRLKNLVGVLKSGNDRVQLVAYADANSNSAARRLSLGRALVVRSKLMELGVPNNKIEVRALGKPEDGSPADRVDLKLITR